MFVLHLSDFYGLFKFKFKVDFILKAINLFIKGAVLFSNFFKNKILRRNILKSVV